MPQSIALWGVVTPDGEPIVGSLDYSQYAAAYRYGAASNVDPEHRDAFWREQQAQGYRVQQFTLHKEPTNG